MTDIVERLRDSDNDQEYAAPPPCNELRKTLAWEAADTIESLRQRVKELEEKVTWYEDREERARCLHCGGVVFELAARQTSPEPSSFKGLAQILLINLPCSSPLVYWLAAV